MNIALRRAITVEEYLPRCNSQSERQRTELINGQILTMPAEELLHTTVKANVLLALRQAIETSGSSCKALADGPGVRIDEHTVYEPDALVYCGASPPPTSMLIPNPVILVEVLSPTTRHSDTSAKLIGYFKLPSVAHYLIVDLDARTVTHHSRGKPPSILSDGRRRLDPPGLDLNLADIFGRA